MGENLTILKKGLILIAIPFFFQVVMLGLLLKTSIDAVEARRLALHSKESIARVENLYRRLVEAHGDLRGLVLTGDPIFRQEVEASLRSIPGELGHLQRFVQENPRQRSQVKAIASRAGELVNWQREIVQLSQSGHGDEAIERVRDLSGKRMLDGFRDAVDAFLDDENFRDTQRMAALATTSRHQLGALAAGGLLSILGITVLALAFARGITLRFAVLSGNAGRLAEGKDLVKPLSGRDEIAQLDRVFHGMARAINEKNWENEMFIYSVSHDLRSPLVNLQGFSQELGHAARDLRGIIEPSELPEFLKKQALGLLDQDIQGSIHFIQTSVSRLSAIIDALLRLSRAGRVEYRWQMVDVKATVNRVVEALGATIAERRARVIVHDLPDAWGDPTAVEQIFANLITNAVHYLDPSRPGLVEIGAANGPSSSTSTQSYFVKDNGHGIPESGMAKLFLVFQRFHENVSQGEGIGLALVRRIIERHGGKIWVESQAGSGSTFHVELPARSPGADAEEPLKPSFEGKKAFV